MTTTGNWNAPQSFPRLWGGYEACDLGRDPASGAEIVRLTSAPLVSNLIYCEQPYGSPDGRRIFFLRTSDFAFSHTCSLMVADLDRLCLTMVERAVPYNFAHSAWGEWLYYPRTDGTLWRISIVTLEKQQVHDGLLTATSDPDNATPICSIESVTPDNRYLFCWERHDTVNDPEIVRYEIATGERRVLYASPDNNNAHMQVDWANGDRVMLQMVERTAAGLPGRVGLYQMDLDGGNFRPFPIGGDWSAQSTGHMAWIGNTGRVAAACEWNRAERRHDARHPQGNLVIASPDDKEPFVFNAPEYGFYHVSISRCGTYFVCDEFMDFEIDAQQSGNVGPARLVVGNLETGKYRVLVSDCKAYGICGSSWTEPVPYFTADNRNVIYNASPFGINQVHMARVPPEFLASLD